MTATEPVHFAAVPISGWGHLRPLLHLSVNLITLHSHLCLTILIPPSASKQVKNELASSSFAHLHEDDVNGQGKILDRLQIINVSSDALEGRGDVWENKNLLDEAQDYAAVLPKFLEPLFMVEKQAKEVANRFKNIPLKFIIYDVFHAFVPSLATELWEKNGQPMIPLLAFCPANATALFYHLAKKENGGYLQLYLDRQAELVQQGIDPLEAMAQVMYGVDGSVKTLPGLPPMYDYELFPMTGSLPPVPQAYVQICAMRAATFHPSTKAFVTPCTAEFEPEAVKAFQAELPVPLLMAGRPVQRKAMTFLDDMEKKHGKRSVAYICLGSMFWPLLRPELIFYLLESLTEHKIPFVYAWASPMAFISEDVQKMIDTNPDCCVVKFAPQWQVLEHDAIKFFLSHCGSNGVAEAILSQVPIVSFPFAADQAEFSTIMTQIYKAAIELTQVKTFKDRSLPKKLYNRPDLIGTENAIKKEMSEVWARIDGPEGQTLRDNMGKVRDLCLASWESGESRRVMVEGIAKFF